MTRTTAQGFCAEPTPVTIRGINYPSQHAAAKALNVPQSTIYIALERGTLDGVGLGRNHDRKRTVIANGVLFDAIADAARHYGHMPESVARYIRIAKSKGKNSVMFKGVEYCQKESQH